jgi:very-short-patch-repair endonuclease
MSTRSPSSATALDFIPEGDNGRHFPSHLACEGGSRKPTDDGYAGSARTCAEQLHNNMIEAEGKLWSVLRGRRFENFKFRRQVPIGKYIVDFACQRCKLIVEVDGLQHQESQHDRVRDAFLESFGYRMLRFSNPDIYLALDGTLRITLDPLNHPPHLPSPARQEGWSSNP